MFSLPSLLYFWRSGLRPSLVQGLRPRNAPLQNHPSPTVCALPRHRVWRTESTPSTCCPSPLTPDPCPLTPAVPRPPTKPSLTDRVHSSQPVGWRAWPRLFTSCVSKSLHGSKDDRLVNCCGLVVTNVRSRTERPAGASLSRRTEQPALFKQACPHCRHQDW